MFEFCMIIASDAHFIEINTTYISIYFMKCIFPELLVKRMYWLYIALNWGCDRFFFEKKKKKRNNV